MPERTGVSSVILAALACALAVMVRLPPLLHAAEAANSTPTSRTNGSQALPPKPSGAGARRGRQLFDHNCASCHGDDARGDEGPSLYNLALSDAKIAARIKNGIKGEMPRFGSKLTDADIEALTAYLRTLKE